MSALILCTEACFVSIIPEESAQLERRFPSEQTIQVYWGHVYIIVILQFLVFPVVKGACWPKVTPKLKKKNGGGYEHQCIVRKHQNNGLTKRLRSLTKILANWKKM